MIDEAGPTVKKKRGTDTQINADFAGDVF